MGGQKPPVDFDLGGSAILPTVAAQQLLELTELSQQEVFHCPDGSSLFICPPVHEVPEAVLDLRHPRPVDGLQVLEPSESLRHRVGHLDTLLSM